MNIFCRQCGTKVDEQTPFCPECGSKIEAPKQGSGGGNNFTSSSLVDSVKNLSIKAKISMISVFVLFLIFGSLYAVASNLTDPTKLLSNFQKALDKGDEEWLVKHLTAYDGESVTENNVKIWLDSDSETVRETITRLRADLQSIEKEKNITSIMAFAGERDVEFLEGTVQLVKDGKRFFFFDHYRLAIVPFSLYVYTNYPEAEVKINGEKVATVHTDGNYLFLGSFLPGEYDMHLTLTAGDLEVTNEEKIVLMERNQTVHSFFDVDDVYVVSLFGEAEIFIDGKATGQYATEDGSYFGPVLTDGSQQLHLEAETPFGKLTSESYMLNGESIFAEYNLDQSTLKRDVLDKAKADLLSVYQAYTHLDSSLVKDKTDNMKDSLEHTMGRLEVHNGVYIYILEKALVDLDYFDFYLENGTWRSNVFLEYEGQIVIKYVDGDNYEEEFNVPLQLSYLYDGDKWVIDEIDSVYGSVSSNYETWEYDTDEQWANAPKVKLTFNAEQLMENYLYNLTDAINWGSFSIVEPYLYPESSLYKDQQKLVTHLYDKGITESVVSFEVKNVTEIAEDEYEIQVTETIAIHSETTKEETFNWKYYAKPHDGKFKLYNLE